MWAAIWKFLKAAGKKAAQTAGKAVKEVKTHPFKTVIKQTPLGKGLDLYEAIKNQKAGELGKAIGGLGGAGTGGAQAGQATQMPASGYNAGMQQETVPRSTAGILSSLQPQSSSKPQQIQYRMPTGESIAQAAEQYGWPGRQAQESPVVPVNPPTMASPQQTTVTPQPMPQPTPQRAPMPGFMRGFTEGLYGIPQTEAINSPDISTGRKTAYYAGTLIPGVIRSKLIEAAATPAAAKSQELGIAKQKLDIAGAEGKLQGQPEDMPFLDPQTGQPVLDSEGNPVMIPRQAKFARTAKGEKDEEQVADKYFNTQQAPLRTGTEKTTGRRIGLFADGKKRYLDTMEIAE